MKQFLILVILFVSTIRLDAGIVKISGISNLPSTSVRLILPSDPISGRTTTLAQTTTDFKGNFEIEANIAHISFAKIAAGLYQSDIVLKPDAAYTIQLTANTTDYTSYFDASPLSLNTLEATDNKLQQQIELINFSYNAFVLEHFQALQRFAREDLIDSLAQVIQKQLPENETEFIDNYLFYKLASVESVVKKLSPAQVYERYFKAKPVLYENPEYFNLFKEYFGSYLFEAKHIGTSKFFSTLKTTENVLAAFMQEDDFYKNDKIFAEIMMLYHLQASYWNPQVSHETVAQHLERIAKESAVTTHRSIAQNIIHMQSRLAYGAKPSGFKLKGNDGQTHDLKDFKGIILLNFLGEKCPLCEHELQSLHSLAQKYAEWLQIISIATPESFKQYSNLFQRRQYNWTLLNLGQDFALLDAYNIRMFPENILLESHSKVAMAAVPMQAEILENHIKKLVSDSLSQ